METAARPVWLPADDEYQAVEAGIWWDAIAIDGHLGTKTCHALRATRGPQRGPIAYAHRNVVPRWYVLSPTGTAATWSEPETQALTAGCRIGLPGSATSLHHPVCWAVPPAIQPLTTGSQLAAALPPPAPSEAPREPVARLPLG